MSADFHDLKIGDELSLALYLAQMPMSQMLGLHTGFTLRAGSTADPLLYCVRCARKCRDEIWFTLCARTDAPPGAPIVTVMPLTSYPPHTRCGTCMKYVAELIHHG